jgi:hypothetical protein
MNGVLLSVIARDVRKAQEMGLLNGTFIGILILRFLIIFYETKFLFK